MLHTAARSRQPAPRMTTAPLSEHTVEAMLSWRYPPPYTDAAPQPSDIFWLLDPDNHYYALYADDTLAGLCCYGQEARVRGGRYDYEPALDIGLSLAPAFCGRGLAGVALATVLAYGRVLRAPLAFRTTVAGWNTAAQRMCLRAGFVAQRTFVGQTRTGTGQFRQLLRWEDTEDT